MNIRHIALAFLTTTLLGCAAFERYQWQETGLPSCKSYVWIQVDASSLASACRESGSGLQACAVQQYCMVYSRYSEAQAKAIYAATCDGVQPTLFLHETECHLKRSLKHTEGT